MFAPFFRMAALSPSRQSSFRRAVVAHLLLLLSSVGWGFLHPANPSTTLAYLLLIAGIVEGAGLIGWRLTQLPKIQSLEFLFVSPMDTRGIFLAEAAVG